MTYGLKAYKKTSVATASREKVLLMLYEGAIKHTKLAIEAIQAKQIAQKGEEIAKVQDIVTELNNSLNHDVGGDISKSLEGLYNFIMEKTTDANIENSVEPLHVCLRILNTLYEGWVGALEEVRKQGGLQNIKVAPDKSAG